MITNFYPIIKSEIDKKLQEYNEYINKAGCSSCAKRAKLGDIGAFIFNKVEPILRSLLEHNKDFFKTIAIKAKEKGVMLASDNIIVVVLKDKNGKPEFHRIHI